ncbi:unnamed protein product [Leptidea sinapis]|uniref:Uncharacterized protein n=1 Tax=Leptidea sinapis TaxID=189913 RepID=A0A5E4PY65_9NEOP|nr:unnamed protein product [Leptidea sinapis]
MWLTGDSGLGMLEVLSMLSFRRCSALSDARRLLSKSDLKKNHCKYLRLDWAVRVCTSYRYDIIQLNDIKLDTRRRLKKPETPQKDMTSLFTTITLKSRSTEIKHKRPNSLIVHTRRSPSLLEPWYKLWYGDLMYGAADDDGSSSG